MLDAIIKKVTEDLQDFENPGSYADSRYYDACSAKADYADDLLRYLKRLKDKPCGD